jgi:hypothetical protein
MNAFKISLKELVILILLSAPIGIFISLHNYNKINYEVKIRRGFAVTENFCENFTFSKMYLQKDTDIEIMAKKYTHKKSSYSKLGLDIKILTRNDNDVYEIKLKGVAGEEASIEGVANKILNDILIAEILTFNDLYKTVQIHCKSGDYNIYRIIPSKEINIEFPVTRSYKKLHLGFLLVLPSLIIYLLMVVTRYLRNIFKKINE